MPTHTHTHTHTYMYAYMYIHVLTYISSRDVPWLHAVASVRRRSIVSTMTSASRGTGGASCGRSWTNRSGKRPYWATSESTSTCYTVARPSSFSSRERWSGTRPGCSASLITSTSSTTRRPPTATTAHTYCGGLSRRVGVDVVYRFCGDDQLNIVRMRYYVYICLSFYILIYIDLGPPVPLGASGDEKSPSVSVTGDPAGSMPADTHLFQVFFGSTSLRPLVVSVAV